MCAGTPSISLILGGVMPEAGGTRGPKRPCAVPVRSEQLRQEHQFLVRHTRVSGARVVRRLFMFTALPILVTSALPAVLVPGTRMECVCGSKCVSVHRKYSPIRIPVATRVTKMGCAHSAACSVTRQNTAGVRSGTRLCSGRLGMSLTTDLRNG